MYISKIHLSNWRSYADGTFEFVKPSERRPVVLVGAMNGHGKTSLLFALYVGLFGRFGLRHAEGFHLFKGDDSPYYREAIRNFRRSSASSDEPTMIEIVFSSVDQSEKVPEIRIVRRWFFNSNGQPKAGDSFETVELFVDEKPQQLHTGIDAAVARLERFLFKADIMPAFFFDGEQAQMLINNSGQDGMKKAVEVLFGTKVIEDALDEVKQFVSTSHAKLGGKRNTDSQQVRLDQRLKERDGLEGKIKGLEKSIRELQNAREQLESDRRNCQETITRLGGDKKAELVKAHAEVDKADGEKRNAERSLTEATKRLGLSLAVCKLAPAITNRLHAEGARERWENLRDGTMNRTAEVLELAAPAPPAQDALLEPLSVEVRMKVRERFQSAIEHIYNPPPTDCASEYVLGHARGESRNRLLNLVEAAKGQGASDIRARAKRLSEAKTVLEEANWRKDRIGNLPDDLEKLSEQLSELTEQISENSRKLGAADNEIKKHKSELQDINADIGKLQELLAKLGPEQKRIAIAERVRNVLSELNEQLHPITVTRLQDSVTKHFVAIADKRYKNGQIVFEENGKPLLRRSNHPDALIEMMSGFERRSFGIAFSLALAEITKKRIPLVIDTPLGNADNLYRRRLLKSLTDVNLDQIIILTHDAEVTGPLFEEIENQIKQTFLVEFDEDRKESTVYADAYFEGVGK